MSEQQELITKAEIEEILDEVLTGPLVKHIPVDAAPYVAALLGQGMGKMVARVEKNLAKQEAADKDAGGEA